VKYKPIIQGVIVIALLFSAGCTPSPKRTALHDFGLASPPIIDQNQSPTKPTIIVDAPTWLWDNRIRYRLLYDAPTQVRFYGLDLWIASPPELFEQRLQNSGSAIPYPLLIHLLDFEQQFDTPKQARVVLRFSVEAYTLDHQRKLGAQLFSLEQVTHSPNAEGAIAGFTALIKQAVVKVQGWAVGLRLK
jgi:cholesterol transport system auxiliary component